MFNVNQLRHYTLASTLIVALGVSQAALASSDKAGRSTELEVDPHFNFTSHRTITLDVSAIDNKSQPIGNALLRVYVVDPDITELEDKRLQHKSLLTLGRTDAAGWLVTDIEIPQTYRKLLVEVQNMEVEQKQLLEITNEDQLSVTIE